ncbi:MAG: hypothetical protein QOH65_2309 [Methylobacteriaceae bacterium]|jgi:hypothetical protein|nr:hypothetical protein [Methylobacteriaceae bacterium]
MMTPRLATSLAFVVLAATATTPAARAAEVRGVVELFTSQGCSSCPPADRYLAELAKDPSLVILSWPVDYWDYIGWKDTFASPAFTARQRAYAAARRDDQVYTPQAVIDGVTHAVGNDRDRVQEAINAQSKTLSCVITLADRDGKVGVDVTPKGSASGSATVWLLRVLRTANVAIGRGENKGRSVSYTNVVREAIPVGEWSGGPMHFDAARPKLGEGEGLVALLQTGTAAKPGAILAAAKE